MIRVLRRRIAGPTVGGTAAGGSSETGVIGSGPTRIPQALLKGPTRARPARGAGPAPLASARQSTSRPPHLGSTAAHPAPTS